MEHKYPTIMSIPKSGTHLLLKLMTSLFNCNFTWNFGTYIPFTTKETFDNKDIKNFEERMNSSKDIICTHSNMVIPYQLYLNKYPSTKTIVIIRDLRDVFTSLLLAKRALSIMDKREYQISSQDKEGLYKILQRLLINDNLPVNVFNLGLCIKNMAEFLRNNEENQNVLVVKFEDLIGIDGGGAKEKQIETINKIANFCEIKITDNKINELSEKLFGKVTDNNKIKTRLELTFREGQIGKWKEYFSDDNMKEFKERYGEMQVQLGYGD